MSAKTLVLGLIPWTSTQRKYFLCLNKIKQQDVLTIINDDTVEEQTIFQIQWILNAWFLTPSMFWNNQLWLHDRKNLNERKNELKKENFPVDNVYHGSLSSTIFLLLYKPKWNMFGLILPHILMEANNLLLTHTQVPLKQVHKVWQRHSVWIVLHGSLLKKSFLARGSLSCQSNKEQLLSPYI